MRSTFKGHTVKILTGEHAGRMGEVVRGATCYRGTGRATVKLTTRRNGRKHSETVRVAVRSLRWMR